MSLDDKLNVAAQMVDSQFVDGTTVQFAWDSVSITNILACPRRYQYSIILGLVANNPARRLELVFGILFHKGLEFYHKHKALGADHEEAIRLMFRQLLDDPNVQQLPYDEEIEEAKASVSDDDDGIGLRNAKVRTRYYLFRALVWYLDHYIDDPVSTVILANGQPAVELSFRIPLQLDVLGVPMLLCGHIDRGVVFNDRFYAGDYKTTKSISRQWFDMFELSHQMTGYSIAGTAIFPEPAKGCMIDGIQLTMGFNKFSRGFTKRTQGQVAEYFETLAYVRDKAILHAETGHYPMNTASCYFCEFKDICSQAPEYRQNHIRQHYTAKPGWNPLENR